MKKEEIINKTAKFVEKSQKGEASGHDWWHTYRVWRTARRIAGSEKADIFIVEMGALLHDIADYKFHGGNEKIGPETARRWLTKMNVEEETIVQICHIVERVSFKGAKTKSSELKIEGKIVQDADRLDGLGAMGIARTFAYGGRYNQAMHDPDYKPKMHDNFESYKQGITTTTSIGHFYEKLLLLKDGMNTKTGRKIAEKRHKFLENFLQEFHQEWKGEI